MIILLSFFIVTNHDHAKVGRGLGSVLEECNKIVGKGYPAPLSSMVGYG